jgi:hypothetical protein
MPAVNGCGAPPRELSSATNQAMLPYLAAAVSHSRENAKQRGIRAIPPAVRIALSEHYSQKELDRIRWTLVDQSVGAANFVVSKGTRYKAMTLGDVIVFEDEAAAGNVALWAHELVHARQFDEAGSVRDFIRIYLAQWPELERDAVRQTNEVLADLNASGRQRLPSLSRCSSRTTQVKWVENNNYHKDR